MKSSELHSVFLQLVRLGIGHSTFSALTNVDLVAVKELAAKQGLEAVVLDGLNDVRSKREDIRCGSLQEKILLAEWIGEVHQFYEQRYEQYLQTIAEMAAFYNSHGFKMMILKGYACSLDWPKPNHRPCGDIDIWQFGRQKEADAALEEWFKSLKVQKFKIDSSHHHHTVFDWQGFMVENHYDFIDVHHRKSGPKLEAIFKELGSEANLNDNDNDNDNDNSVGNQIPCVKVESASTGSATKVYFPSPNLHALFLVYHTMLHFTSTEMNIRQLLDWGLFAEKHKDEIDWNWLKEMLNDFHLMDFFNIINAICVDDLGFDAKIFKGVKFNYEMKERVLNDTLSPEFTEEEPKNIVRRFFFRYRRWKSHDWKHKLCYEESMWSIFWSAVWSHILKPKSI